MDNSENSGNPLQDTFLSPKPSRGRGPDKKPRKSGPDHGLYIHGKGKMRDYDPKLYAAWKEGVLQKYSFRCFITKETEDLQCHHLNSWDISVDGRYDINNGIPLQKRIHQQFHQEYGSGKNTIEQFEKFLKENYQIEDFPWQNENHDPNLTIENIQARQASQKELKKQELLDLIAQRKHELVEAPEGFTARVRISIYCTIHKEQSWTTPTNYRKSRTGMPCCGRQIQSEKGTWAHVNAKRKKK